MKYCKLKKNALSFSSFLVFKLVTILAIKFGYNKASER